MSRLYVIFYCLIRDDGTQSLHKRTKLLIELFLAQILFAISEIVIGVFNLTPDSYFFYLIIGGGCALAAYIIITIYFNKNKGEIITEKYAELIKRRKISLALLSVSILIFAFASLFLSGMIMSFLFSLHN